MRQHSFDIVASDTSFHSTSTPSCINTPDDSWYATKKASIAESIVMTPPSSAQDDRLRASIADAQSVGRLEHHHHESRLHHTFAVHGQP
jgi:hypothetical protein